MIVQKIRLIDPKEFQVDHEEINLNHNVIVRPLFLSICEADKRYYFGKRPEKILRQKLPMAIIHEGVGEVVYDSTGTYSVGQRVVMIPNTPTQISDRYNSNYDKTSKFRASGFDGFTQGFVEMDKDLLVKYDDLDMEIGSFIELFSVAMHSVCRFESQFTRSVLKNDIIGVWGNGNFGFMVSMILKEKFPCAKIHVFGTNKAKLDIFKFVDKTFNINDVDGTIKVDHAFECVGGTNAHNAIQQVIDCINPQGIISLLGVSEEKPQIETRMILEKGLILFGSSRSSKVDYEEAIKFLKEHPKYINYLKLLISEVIEVKCVDDLHRAFSHSSTNTYKTVMKWSI